MLGSGGRGVGRPADWVQMSALRWAMGSIRGAPPPAVGCSDGAGGGRVVGGGAATVVRGTAGSAVWRRWAVGEG